MGSCYSPVIPQRLANGDCMRKAFIVCGLLAALGTGAFAQDYIFTFFSFHNDVVLEKPPCQLLGAATMTVYDHSPWIVYTCAADGHVVLRRYHNPTDTVREPLPVFQVENPDRPKAPPGATDGTYTCTVPGWVVGIYGGCVPPGHPNAPK
jgi:hypothetical protein